MYIRICVCPWMLLLHRSNVLCCIKGRLQLQTCLEENLSHSRKNKHVLTVLYVNNTVYCARSGRLDIWKCILQFFMHLLLGYFILCRVTASSNNHLCIKNDMWHFYGISKQKRCNYMKNMAHILQGVCLVKGNIITFKVCRLVTLSSQEDWGFKGHILSRGHEDMIDYTFEDRWQKMHRTPPHSGQLSKLTNFKRNWFASAKMKTSKKNEGQIWVMGCARKCWWISCPKHIYIYIQYIYIQYIYGWTDGWMDVRICTHVHMYICESIFVLYIHIYIYINMPISLRACIHKYVTRPKTYLGNMYHLCDVPIGKCSLCIIYSFI